MGNTVCVPKNLQSGGGVLFCGTNLVCMTFLSSWGRTRDNG